MSESDKSGDYDLSTARGRIEGARAIATENSEAFRAWEAAKASGETLDPKVVGNAWMADQNARKQVVIEAFGPMSDDDCHRRMASDLGEELLWLCDEELARRGKSST